jgi:large conductance mechanosensitive channel
MSSTQQSTPKPHVASIWWRDFRAFFQRGSVVDLAVGVMIGASFGKIVSSFVNDLLMPPLGLLMGGMNFSSLKLTLGGSPTAPVTLNYGSFLQALMDFTLIALVLFLLVSLVNRLHRRAPGPAPGPTADQLLLTEIRDELRRQNSAANPRL